MTPDVSVILPCYKAADAARRSVRELAEVLSGAFGGGWEIIVVDDGGGDFPARWCEEVPEARLIRFDRNRGKGAAVAAGMKAARGRARVYTDVDLPYGSALIEVIVDYLTEGPFHLVVGDRTLPASRYKEDLRPSRRLLSGLSTTFIGTLVTGGFFDTQCGLKGIRGDIADLLFSLVRIDGFAFDVEVVYLALRFNCDIKRIPVRLRAGHDTSTVRPIRDGAVAAANVLGIKRRAMLGEYECPPLTDLIRAEFERRLSAARREVSGKSRDGAPA